MRKARKEKQYNLYNKGITLISLVITIIVLIILAGVSINLVLGGDGIIAKAKEAQAIILNAQAEEEARLAELEMQMQDNENLPENTEETAAGTQVKLPNEWIPTDGTGKISVRAIATGKGKEVPMPKGFYYVGGTPESGVVISDNAKDKNKYADYKPTEGEKGIPAGVVYDTNTGIPKTENQLTDEEKQTVILGNQFVWIPVELEDYKKETWTAGTTKYENVTYDAEPIESELAQIEKYGGFYVGRYEAGTSEIKLSTGVDFAAQNKTDDWQDTDFSIRDDLNNHTATGEITSKPGEIPYYHADYFTALELSNRMYKTNYVQSGLVTGTMWDSIMKFIAGDDTLIVTTKSTWGNYNKATDGVTFTKGQGRYAEVDSSNGSMKSAFQPSNGEHRYGIRTTASTEGVKQKNLYDIAGNLWEWTQEEAYPNNKTVYYMMRGGAFHLDYSNYPACYRYGYTETNTNTTIGFRSALYIM